MIFLKEIGLVAETFGFKAYLVGGAVRDLIMRNKNLDIDIVIEGDGIIFAKKFSETFPCKVRSHQRFGTAIMIFPDGFKIDVATARLEYYEKPGALPTVELSSIKLDLYRRDFSINTLAVRLNPDGYGELLDFYGGLKDLKSKTIRVLHNLSFVEDPTRILRALRFEQKFGFCYWQTDSEFNKKHCKTKSFQKCEWWAPFDGAYLYFTGRGVHNDIKKNVSFWRAWRHPPRDYFRKKRRSSSS